MSERRTTSLADMMKYAIKVEVNLTVSRKKKRDEGEWRREEGDRRKEKEPEQHSSSNSQDSRMDMMMKTMEKLMEIFSIDNRPAPRENKERQNINQNPRRPKILQKR